MREDREWRVVRRKTIDRRLSRYPITFSGQREYGVGKEKIISVGRSLYANASRSEKEGGYSKEYVTLMFRYYPEDCSIKTMISKFQCIGEVRDVFCQKKKDKTGNLFGFVRFSKTVDEEFLLERLNNVWFGSYMLRAFHPRYEREQITQTKKQEPTKIPINSGLREENRTYANAVFGFSNEKINEEVEKTDIQFETTIEDREWILDCFTSFLKRKFSWEEHAEELVSECGSVLKLRSMGENLVLIQQGGDRSVKETLEDFDEWTKF